MIAKAVTQGERRTISVEEAGRQLGLSRNTAYQAAGRGEIPTIRIGRRMLVPLVAFERLLNQSVAMRQEGA
ncbi:helix-turn-helix domain-containing protein [Methylobacterium flocculans]|uniref:helix-turn-helix domain-containing protein n=1 Tax=Methylobacterium flocculans TaxID=2984843 RepID=UPI0021F30A36|nr:helix-turn-helix domain-containing protein [Methylobacterium sp. FF17]